MANENTASGAKASALKRKSSASASSASGAIPPTQRPRTSEADDTLEANNSVERDADTTASSSKRGKMAAHK